MKVADKNLPGMMAAGLERFIKAQTGHRLDKRSVTAGYYAAAAIFAAAVDKDAMVETFVNRGTDAIERVKDVQSQPAPIASGVPFDGRKS